MLQLGFLKLLKGSALRMNSDNYGIEYKDKAPYEVLYTEHISFDELMRLKDVEHLLDIYYNSSLALNTFKYAITMFDTAFDFFDRFARFWNSEGLHRASHSRQTLYEILFRYIMTINGAEQGFVKDLIKLDMFMAENVKNLPSWLDATDYKPIMNGIHNFFANEENAKKYFPKLLELTPKQLSRVCHIERFSYRVLDFITSDKKEFKENYCLFVYDDGHTQTYNIDLAEVQDDN